MSNKIQIAATKITTYLTNFGIQVDTFIVYHCNFDHSMAEAYLVPCQTSMM